MITNHVEKVTEEGSKHINAIMLRLSNVYGSTKDHPERLIPAIVRNAVSNRPIQMVGGDQDVSKHQSTTDASLTWSSLRTLSTPCRLPCPDYMQRRTGGSASPRAQLRCSMLARPRPHQPCLSFRRPCGLPTRPPHFVSFLETTDSHHVTSAAPLRLLKSWGTRRASASTKVCIAWRPTRYVRR